MDCNELQSDVLYNRHVRENRPAALRHRGRALLAIDAVLSVSSIAARPLRPIRPEPFVFILTSLALRGRAGQCGSRAENRERDKQEHRRELAGYSGVLWILPSDPRILAVDALDLAWTNFPEVSTLAERKNGLSRKARDFFGVGG
jgi:hypothetical protein